MKLFRKKDKVTREQFIAQDLEKAILGLFNCFEDKRNPELQDFLTTTLKELDLKKELKGDE